MRSQHHTLLALCILLPLTANTAAGEGIVRPPGLEPNVVFWERVYSEVEGSGGLIHDDEYLDVVYEILRFREGLSRSARERQVKQAKARVREALNVLARGKRSGLSAREAEVLALWPEGTTNATFRRAASNIRFQLGQADRFREGLVRSGAWLDHIQQRLRHHGVPVELAALPHVESSFNPNAYSRVGAAGLWQFTRSTGHLFLHIDSVVDERLDPWKASDAAARLLAKNREITGTWPLAITAYNHGAAGMKRAARTLGTTDITTIVHEYKSRTFGFASRNFYASFLAAVAVDRRAHEIFGHLQSNPRIDYTVIEMPHFYRAASLSAALGVDQTTLREHNGALRPAVWQGHKYVPRGYPLRVPSTALAREPELLLAAIPQRERLAEQHRDRFHTVHRGETLSRIAAKYGVTQSQLVALNNLRSRHRIRVGQVLTLPGGVAPPVDVARQPLPSDGYYTVRRGDTLSIISRRFDVAQSALVAENGLRNRNRIHVGQRLRIPGAAPIVIASTAPVAPPPAPRSAGQGDPEIVARLTDPQPEKPVAEATPPQGPVVDEAPSQTGSTLADAAEPKPPESPGPESPTRVARLPELETPTARPPEPEPTLVPQAAPPKPEPTVVARPEPPTERLPEPEPERRVARVLEPEPETRVAGVPDPKSETRVVLEPDPETSVAGVPEPEPQTRVARVPDPEPRSRTARVPDPTLRRPASAALGRHPNAPDPSDYSVHDGRVTVQAAETLGHYAEWLETRASQLRRKNGMQFEQPLVIGSSVRLDFSRVTPEEFERRRLEHHRTLQSEFFDAFEVTGTETHVLRRGETLWYLAERKYRIPVWLLRQYNPELDFGSLPAGSAMVVPVVEPRAS